MLNGLEKMREEYIIRVPKLPFDPDANIFSTHYECDCEGECIYPKQSYNEWLDEIKSISGVNEELLGSKPYISKKKSER